MWNPRLDAGLVAQVIWDPELIALLVVLTVLIVLGLRIILWVKRWQHDETDNPSPQEELSSFRQLLEQGILQQEEFDRVHARLEAKAKGRPESQPQDPSTPSAPDASAPEPGA